MSATRAVQVNHVNGITVGYQMPHIFYPRKPTLILINPFALTSDIFRKQFDYAGLADLANLIAIEPLGHGITRTTNENFSYWDTAIMNIQVMDALGIETAFVLGANQGGWIGVRMALLAPDRIRGLILLGSSMDYESPRSRQLGCWNSETACYTAVHSWTRSASASDFEPDDNFCNSLINRGFGNDCEAGTREYWTQMIKRSYSGDDGRRRIRMAAINLCDRDGLHRRLFDVRCPILWMQGTRDAFYSVANAEQEIELFANAREARLVTVSEGCNYLNASNSVEVNTAVVDFVNKWQSDLT